MTNTHINTFIENVEKDYKDALAALAKFHDSVEALKGKYASHVSEIAIAVGQSVPEIEALVPAAKPEIDKAEEDVDKVEEDAKEIEADAGKASAPKAKS